ADTPRPHAPQAPRLGAREGTQGAGLGAQEDGMQEDFFTDTTVRRLRLVWTCTKVRSSMSKCWEE
ncbi:MAG: hypothetical protein L0L28_05055, partial [Corynebacterium flavescens]|uniref:hypothetical protein n=1 Tax=Corynebacterium flavescens TaxID=28028 RepID=UPI002648A9A1